MLQKLRSCLSPLHQQNSESPTSPSDSSSPECAWMFRLKSTSRIQKENRKTTSKKGVQPKLVPRKPRVRFGARAVVEILLIRNDSLDYLYSRSLRFMTVRTSLTSCDSPLLVLQHGGVLDG